MFEEKINIGQDLLNVPMGDMIKDMAFAIAEAQLKLDSNSMEVAEMMGGLHSVEDPDTGETIFTDSRVFFGKEKVPMSRAVEIYNTSNSPSEKAIIETKLGSNVSRNYDLDVVEFNLGALEDSNLVFPDNKREDVYYKPKDNENFYKYDGVNTNYALIDEPEYATLTFTGANDDDIYIPQRLSMMELGFAPTFYQFVDTIIEVKISIKYSASQSTTKHTYDSQRKTVKNGSGWFFSRRRKRRRAITTSQVNGNFSQKFSYSAEGSSLLRTKLVPIPPPSILEERIQQQMEMARLEKLEVE